MTATGGFEQCEGIAMLDVVWFVVECRGVNREALHRPPGFPTFCRWAVLGPAAWPYRYSAAAPRALSYPTCLHTSWQVAPRDRHSLTTNTTVTTNLCRFPLAQAGPCDDRSRLASKQLDRPDHRTSIFIRSGEDPPQRGPPSARRPWTTQTGKWTAARSRPCR